MKENLETFIASIGCLPLLGVSLFLSGVFLGQAVPLELPAPAPWVFIPIFLLPIFSTLYFRAYRQQQRAARWLEAWPLARRVVVGRRPQGKVGLEEVWLEAQLKHAPHRNQVARILDNTALWGWAMSPGLLALAYVSIWFGMMTARGG